MDRDIRDFLEELALIDADSVEDMAVAMSILREVIATAKSILDGDPI